MSIPDILQQIVATKKQEVAAAKARVPEVYLKAQVASGILEQPRNFFAALTDTGYNGAVCIEVEDRAYERDVNDRKRALLQSKRFLEQFMG